MHPTKSILLNVAIVKYVFTHSSHISCTALIFMHVIRLRKKNELGNMENCCVYVSWRKNLCLKYVQFSSNGNKSYHTYKENVDECTLGEIHTNCSFIYWCSFSKKLLINAIQSDFKLKKTEARQNVLRLTIYLQLLNETFAHVFHSISKN